MPRSPCRSRSTASRSGRRRRASRSSPRRSGCGCRPLRSAAAAALAAYGALAGLVASGATTGLDQWAVEHAMPLAGRPQPPPTFLESVVPLLHAGFHPADVAVVQIVTLPGQVVISLLLVAVAARQVWRRGRAEAALSWLIVWFSAVAVEVVFRHALSRPSLYRDGLHLVAFDTSWPSGHALRCSLVAAALAAAWPRLRVPLAIWLVAAVVLLELAGFHTPTDIVGGLLLAATAAAAAGELERSGLLRRRLALRRARSST